LYCEVGGKQEETIKSDVHVTGKEDKRKGEKLKLGIST
jgi:hypothetical protein